LYKGVIQSLIGLAAGVIIGDVVITMLPTCLIEANLLNRDEDKPEINTKETLLSTCFILVGFLFMLMI